MQRKKYLLLWPAFFCYLNCTQKPNWGRTGVVDRSERWPSRFDTIKSGDGWLSLVEGTGFENRRRGNSTGGSNPSPSAFSFVGFSFEVWDFDSFVRLHRFANSFFCLRFNHDRFASSVGGGSNANQFSISSVLGWPVVLFEWTGL